MSTLVVVGYKDMYKAEEVRIKLWKLQLDYLLDMEDAVVVVKDAKGKVKLHQAHNLTTTGAMSGGMWGALIGMLFLNPVLGFAVGASAGAISGSLTDIGISDTVHEGTRRHYDTREFDTVRSAKECYSRARQSS